MTDQPKIFYVSSDGLVRKDHPWPSDAIAKVRRTEERALAAQIANAAPPDECSVDVPISPARGPVTPYQDYHVVAVGAEDFEVTKIRYKSGAPARALDLFDKMMAQSSRRRDGPAFTMLHAMAARKYRDLTEQVKSSGLAASPVFSDKLGGSGKRDAMDAYMANTQRLAWMHASIGDAIAKDIKRKAKAIDNGGRIVGEVELRQIGKRLITVRMLVDLVCLQEKSLRAVLMAHGWRDSGKNLKTLRAALCAALERISPL
ncbi:MAG: hypothetical protein AAGL89_12800 [Pseudomonadota bacterium]